jgi:hypothetical protein
VSELESANLKLNQRISDLAQNIEDQNSGHRAQVTVIYLHSLKYGQISVKGTGSQDIGVYFKVYKIKSVLSVTQLMVKKFVKGSS